MKIRVDGEGELTFRAIVHAEPFQGHRAIRTSRNIAGVGKRVPTYVPTWEFSNHKYLIIRYLEARGVEPLS